MPIAMCYIIGPSSTNVLSHINFFLSYLYKYIYAQEVWDHYFLDIPIFDLYNLQIAVSLKYLKLYQVESYISYKTSFLKEANAFGC